MFWMWLPLYSASAQLLENHTLSYLAQSDRLMSYEELKLDWKMAGQVQVFVNEGINYLAEGNPSVALENFTQALTLDPTFWQGYYYRAMCYKQLREWQHALFDLGQVLKAKPGLYEALLEQGKLMQLQRFLVEAREKYEQSIDVEKRRAQAHYMLADVCIDERRFVQAIRELELCLKYDSMFQDAHLRLAVLAIFHQENKNAAMKHIEKVLRHDSLQYDAILFRVLLSSDMKSPRMLRDVNIVVQRRPGDMSALLLRGMVFSEQGQYDRAFADFSKIVDKVRQSDNSFVGKQTDLDHRLDIQNASDYTVRRVYGLNDDDAAKIKKAYCLMMLGKYGEAVNSINQTSVVIEEPLCWYLKAVASEHQKNHSEAFRYYQKAVEIDADILDAHKKLAIYMQEMKAWNESIKELNKALKINPQVVMLYKIRGVAYYYQKQYLKSVEDFTRFLKYDSTDKEVYAYRGVAFLQNGNFLPASLDFARAERYTAMDFRKLTVAVDSLLKADSVMGFEYLDKVTRYAPVFTEGYARKMKIYEQRGNWSQALEELGRSIRNSRSGAPDRDHASLLRMKAVLLARDKAYDLAIDTMRDVLNFDRSSENLLTRARLYLEINKTNKAVSDLKEAASMGNAEASALLAKVSK